MTIPKYLRTGLTLAVTMTALVVPVSSYAFVLGDLNVLSALDQPFRAEIDVSALKVGEAKQLTISVASPAEFEQAGLNVHPLLSTLQFDVVTEDQRATILMHSTVAMTSPSLHLLLTATTASDQVVQQYHIQLAAAEGVTSFVASEELIASDNQLEVTDLLGQPDNSSNTATELTELDPASTLSTPTLFVGGTDWLGGSLDEQQIQQSWETTESASATSETRHDAQQENADLPEAVSVEDDGLAMDDALAIEQQPSSLFSALTQLDSIQALLPTLEQIKQRIDWHRQLIAMIVVPLLVFLLWFRRSRRRQKSTESKVPSTSELPQQEVVAEPVSQDKVEDLVEQADMFIGYADYTQAEQVLQKACAIAIDNEAIKQKLLFVLYKQKQADKFMAVITAAGINNSHQDWQKICQWGQELLPNNALFATIETETQRAFTSPDLNFEIGGLSVQEEADAKLEVASTFLDMGDVEGAKALLTEVLHSGSDRQQAQAQRLLERC